MEHEIIWDSEPEDAYVKGAGTATVEAMDSCIQSLTSDPRFRAGSRVLIDHRQADWSQMTPRNVLAVVNLLSRAAARFGATHCAMVMGRAVDFGLARMQQHYAEADSELQIEFRIFSTIDDARRWLSALPAPEQVRSS